ncbi:MAG: hypothetical protein AAGC79_07560 [Pseudomonadota bacterium]
MTTKVYLPPTPEGVSWWAVFIEVVEGKDLTTKFFDDPEIGGAFMIVCTTAASTDDAERKVINEVIKEGGMIVDREDLYEILSPDDLPLHSDEGVADEGLLNVFSDPDFKGDIVWGSAYCYPPGEELVQ